MRRKLLRLKAEACAELAYYASRDAEEERIINKEAQEAVHLRLEAKELNVMALKEKRAKFEKGCEEELRVMIVKKNVSLRGVNRNVTWCCEDCGVCGGGRCDDGEYCCVVLGWEEGGDSRCVKCAAEDSYGGLLPTDLIA